MAFGGCFSHEDSRATRAPGPPAHESSQGERWDVALDRGGAFYHISFLEILRVFCRVPTGSGEKGFLGKTSLVTHQTTEFGRRGSPTF